MPLTAVEKDTLLKIARVAMETYVRERKKLEFSADDPGLKDMCGAFVSLHKDTGLRGCIGTFASPAPLYKTVPDMAIAAAVNDPRFKPVTPGELKDISVEISVLTPLKEIKDAQEVVVGRHGLYIVKGRKKGVLLPQVAVEHNFDRLEFLEQTCVKAGLKPDDWKEGATIFVFEAEIFKEG